MKKLAFTDLKAIFNLTQGSSLSHLAEEQAYELFLAGKSLAVFVAIIKLDDFSKTMMVNDLEKLTEKADVCSFHTGLLWLVLLLQININRGALFLRIYFGQ
jgi:hypothetical protein